MGKKAITYRPMYGFSDKPRLAKSLELGGPISVQPVDKDDLIRQLRASLEVLEAREAKRLTVSREAMRKMRAKTKPKP